MNADPAMVLVDIRRRAAEGVAQEPARDVDQQLTRQHSPMPSKDTREALIFVHMFRSGGNTLSRIMDWEYSPLRIFSLNGRYCRWAYKKLTELPAAALSGMQVFRGHMPFGLHRHLTQPSTYITLLREPVERTLSEYFAGLNRISHRQHRTIKHLSVCEFVATLANNNSQTKMIAGLSSSYDFLTEECSSHTLDTAKHNLQQYFSLVGITERFEETLALAKCRFAWNVPHYAWFNSNPKRTHNVSSELRHYIMEHNRFDVELYRHAVTLFNKQLTEHAEEVAQVFNGVRSARLIKGSRLVYYRTASRALKAFGLLSSTARSFLPVGVSRYLRSGERRV